MLFQYSVEVSTFSERSFLVICVGPSPATQRQHLRQARPQSIHPCYRDLLYTRKADLNYGGHNPMLAIPVDVYQCSFEICPCFHKFAFLTVTRTVISRIVIAFLPECRFCLGVSPQRCFARFLKEVIAKSYPIQTVIQLSIGKTKSWYIDIKNRWECCSRFKKMKLCIGSNSNPWHLPFNQLHRQIMRYRLVRQCTAAAIF